eukprot:CAMPEP_0172532304 /NCGR_PEP_ID=MMETSP1067-20121228/5407_1 /TAXON_ID=265564 ORGANISM="Thalassiosira punctigera, Strain Tpunct2005C2" /NCGR_SAMPLE_ID=MMETSP1067 /ASSEMBLY_ACC=CAM_ASM_000444 /LENGTH=211 /DNA_ID=CAMNT_0013316809 /DNA_START=41 /DNA_END=676 /DNA_ORIENTATION=-
MHAKNNNCILSLALAAVLAAGCSGFTTAPAGSDRLASTTTLSMALREEGGGAERGRRSVLSSFLATAATASALLPSEALAEAETMERGGVKLTPFNSLAFNYRGGDSPSIDPTTLNEASIPYSEFLEKLNSDQVAFVEFLAPNGDAAYAMFKPNGEGGGSAEGSKPIRIGEGYPVEDPGGWSSPAFVIKAVAKKGVPYKFVVPGLGDSFKL